ncbi:uncharacterized protein LTR77_007943 [Saxophila tyrrhenica]|uniref:Uncharacterized protein n=1 Tax=Saxophila tyrrhenica TaxID=1690608 RepID=A0AAV9P6G2_9PEZI|nr:hypothetical protein LTR77_007943 [Saxophila tyrrhenica]
MPLAEEAKSGRRDSKQKGVVGESPSSPSGDDGDDTDKKGLSVIPDDDEDLETDEYEPLSAASDQRIDTGAASWIKKEPAAEIAATSARPPRPQASRTNSRQTAPSSVFQHSKYSSLTRDDKVYLKYHRDNLSHHHYAFKYDAGDFLKTTFLEIAMNDPSQALLYSIIAFSAYHRSIERGDVISDFLSYYNKSIILLHQSLKSKKPGIATLLTILQLATIEEFLGDWSNLLGHQKAAHQILTDLFTPQTIMQDETRRRIIAWYIRFDLFAGMMSGSETRLGREWFAACNDHYVRQARDRPDDLVAKFEEYFSTSRLLATDVALLFAGKVKGTVSDEQFGAKTADLASQFSRVGRVLETAFRDPQDYVKDFPRGPPPSEDDIFNFQDPNFLLGGDLFTMNFVRLDFWSIDLMYKYNMTKVRGRTTQEEGEELTSIAMRKCKMIDAIQYSDQGPPGAVIGCQASLGIASLFLPKDERHTNWCRRKYALIEQLGYIYPVNLRKQLSDSWGVDVSHWWLPNDEGYPDIVRAIRDFIDYRSEVPKDTLEAHLREMSGIFKNLNVDEQSSSAGTDSEQRSPQFGQSVSFESSPEQSWQS